MSATLAKRTLAAAEADAAAFRALFDDRCFARWEVAGSVRRRWNEVGDVEHVVIPTVGDVADSSSLFAAVRQVNLLLERLDELVRTYMVTKHVYGTNPTTGEPVHRWGQKYRGVDFRGFCHEIFSADADNWGPTLAIRTGPGTYSRMLVTALQRHGHVNDLGYVWNKNDMTCAGCGWKGAFAGERGLLFVAPEDWVATLATAGVDERGQFAKPKFVNGRDRAGVCPQCRRPDGLSMRRVSVPDERAYFELCRVAWCEPWQRREVVA